MRFPLEDYADSGEKVATLRPENYPLGEQIHPDFAGRLCQTPIQIRLGPPRRMPIAVWREQATTDSADFVGRLCQTPMIGWRLTQTPYNFSFSLDRRLTQTPYNFSFTWIGV